MSIFCVGDANFHKGCSSKMVVGEGIEVWNQKSIFLLKFLELYTGKVRKFDNKNIDSYFGTFLSRGRLGREHVIFSLNI